MREGAARRTENSCARRPAAEPALPDEVWLSRTGRLHQPHHRPVTKCAHALESNVITLAPIIDPPEPVDTVNVIQRPVLLLLPRRGPSHVLRHLTTSGIDVEPRHLLHGAIVVERYGRRVAAGHGNQLRQDARLERTRLIVPDGLASQNARFGIAPVICIDEHVRFVEARGHAPGDFQLGGVVQRVVKQHVLVRFPLPEDAHYHRFGDRVHLDIALDSALAELVKHTLLLQKVHRPLLGVPARRRERGRGPGTRRLALIPIARTSASVPPRNPLWGKSLLLLRLRRLSAFFRLRSCLHLFLPPSCPDCPPPTLDLVHIMRRDRDPFLKSTCIFLTPSDNLTIVPADLAGAATDTGLPLLRTPGGGIHLRPAWA